MLHKLARKVVVANSIGESPGGHGSDGVKVTVRVRPFIAEELARGDAPELCVAMPTKTDMEIKEHLYKEKSQCFTFDRTYWSHDSKHELFATQATLYEELGKSMLIQALNGYNTCIFAYGQTGSGKSYSVLGSDTEEGRGLLPRLVQGLFEVFDQASEEEKCTCKVSFMEIYNEQIKDLLSSGCEEVKKEKLRTRSGQLEEQKEQKTFHGDHGGLKVRVHPVLGTIVVGLTDVSVHSRGEVMALIDEGTAKRTVGSTAMNFGSSRSHCIFTFKTSVTAADGVAKISQTHLVDLAGSERANRTQATGGRLKEGAAINQSLSTLSRVISALAENAAKGGKNVKNPPFRDSKLTFVLKESLSGNSRTYMMAAISPSLGDYEETMSTLRFAQSVKKVQLSAVANEAHTGNEKAMVQKLQEELATMRRRIVKQRFVKAIEIARLKEKAQQVSQQEHLCERLGLSVTDLLKAAECQRGLETANKVRLTFDEDQDEDQQPRCLARGASQDVFFGQAEHRQRRMATMEIDPTALEAFIDGTDSESAAEESAAESTDGADVKALKAEVERLGHQLEDREDELATQRVMVSALQQEKELILQERDIAKLDKGAVEKQLDAARCDLEAASKERDTARQELTTALSHKQEAAQDAERLRLLSDTQDSALLAAYSSDAQKSDKINDLNKSLDKSASQLETEQAKADEVIVELRRSLAAQQAASEELQRKLDIMTRKLETSEGDLAAKETKLQTLQAELSEWRTVANARQVEVDTLQETCGSLEEALGRTKKQLSEFVAKDKAKADELAELMKLVNALEEAKQSADGRRKSIVSQVVQDEEPSSWTGPTMTPSDSEGSASLRRLLESAEGRARAAEEELAALRQQQRSWLRADKTEELRAQLSAKDSELQQLRTELSEQEERHAKESSFSLGSFLSGTFCASRGAPTRKQVSGLSPAPEIAPVAPRHHETALPAG
eukprot:TRINITY_DN111753_c0_g1_i1.p1 TRINITY_DN111753_c0_g1~~TRINITY_DN111753_c0_g1_i1.p1  ORF type:complete len:961 (+),score=278.41 TRINITY_DN111753_c0_g1_i1:71-2953(+)